MWVIPPIKDHYKNKFPHQLTKPVLVVNNKFTIEWYLKPYNFQDVFPLYQIFSRLCNGEIYTGLKGCEKGYQGVIGLKI